MKQPSFEARIYGGWLGKSVGGTLGLPAEGKPGPLNFTYYDPVPVVAPPNDDLELQLVWLHLLETRGVALTQADLAEGWLRHIHYMWDEYGRCRWNLRRGVAPAAAGRFENWFVSGMGSPIRSEIWAVLCAGRPSAAAAYARLDASLDHGPEGIAGEVYLAVLQALLLDGVELFAAAEAALAWLDPVTETARAIRAALEGKARGLSAGANWQRLEAAHRHDNFTHTPLNLAIIAWALVHGEGKFDETLLLAVNRGADTDCTAATVGAILGMARGPDAIAERWTRPIGCGVFVGPGILGIHAPDTLEALTARSAALTGLAPAAGKILPSVPPPELPSVETLPGTIGLEPLAGGSVVPWANGELPEAVLENGGANWLWRPGPESKPGCHLVALAKSGARLWVDGELLIDCPPGLPFVPAVHRPPNESRAFFAPTRDEHRIRLELGARDPAQEASVLLGTRAMHLTTWDGTVLPHAPLLPA